MVQFTKFLVGISLIVAFTMDVNADENTLGTKGKALEKILNGACNQDANERCDAYPVEECKDTFTELCSECLENLDNGEVPSKRCLVDCALLHREELVAQNCTAPNEGKMKQQRAVQFGVKRKSRIPKCSSAILASCPTECAGIDDKTISKESLQACWACVEENATAIGESAKESDCAKVNPHGKCVAKLQEVCSECLTTPSDGEFDEDTMRARGECLESCMEENKSVLTEAGCKKPTGDRPVPQPQSEECRDKAEELCGTCAENEDDGIPTKHCLKTCFLENKDKLKEAGCTPRFHQVPSRPRGFLGRFRRVFQCFKDDILDLSRNCTDVVEDVDGEPELTENDVDTLFAGAIEETESLIPSPLTGAFVAVGVVAGCAVVGGVAMYVRKQEQGESETVDVLDHKLSSENPRFEL